MKYFFIFLILSSAFISRANDKLDIIAKIPSQLLPGKSYNVEVIINKGDLTSYAYFEHELPAGISAEEAISDKADFSFEAGKVRLVWLRLPERDRVKIVYKINVPKDTVGVFDVKGRFSYIINNKRGEVSLRPSQVIIGTEEQIKSMPVKKNQFAGANTAGVSAMAIQIKREEPDYMDFDKSYSVILLVKKDTMSHPLIIQESLPKGFKPQPLQLAGGKFSTKGNMAIFEWDVLPKERYFTVSYLAKGKKHTPQLAFDVSGKYTYKVGKKSYSFYIDRNYGEGHKRPSIEELQKRKLFSNLDTSLYKVTKPIKKDTLNKPVDHNKKVDPKPKDPTINEIKSIFN